MTGASLPAWAAVIPLTVLVLIVVVIAWAAWSNRRV